MPDDDEIDLMELAHALWRGKWLIAVAALLALIVGAYYALGVVEPRYQSSAKLTLEMRTNQLVDIESVISGVSTETAALNTEIEIILSRRVLGKLVDKLNLVDDPEFNSDLRAPSGLSQVIGTVKGDIHDIGKNLVSMMMEGAGFEVVDLGINNSVEVYLEAMEKEGPDILGMSALLTTTMPYMKVVIDTMVEQGIRDDYIVLVGGAPLNEEFGRAIGADAYCRDAAVAVETAKEWVGRKHNRASA
jgi:methylmalonyl-CoA mutase cobalamin-binding subunit